MQAAKHLFFPVLVFLALAGSASAQQADTAAAGRQARQVIQQFNAGQYAEIYNQCDAAMKSALSADKLKGIWQTILTQNGAYKKIEAVKMSVLQGYRNADVRIAFANRKSVLRLTFDAKNKLAGIHIME